MRKGLTVTLFTVAIAILGYDAMSLAPTISDMPHLIVADDAPVSGGNNFTYPDTMGLDGLVTDDTTADDQLVWSYFEPTGKYRVNDADSLTGDGVSPAAAEIIAGPGATTTGDPDDVDADLATPTIRNADLSPIVGPDVDPPGSGIIASETAALTFFVSDGDLTDSDTIIVYTDDDGTDRYSPSGAPIVINWDFTTGVNGWVFAAGAGTATQSSSGAICIDVPAAGDNRAQWNSPYGGGTPDGLDLVDNTGIEIRLTMGTNQTTQGAIPFWDFIINNSVNIPAEGATEIGANAYGGDFWFLDNIGGSQGIDLPNGRSEFRVYFAPAAAQLASWRDTSTGAFQAAADPFNDMSFSLRVFDIGSAGYGAASDSGTVCLERMTVGRFSLDSIVRGTVVYSDSDLQTGDWKLGGTGANLAFSGGNMNISPASATSWTDVVDVFTPGPAPAGNPVDDPLNWPIAWTADKILLYEVAISVPDAASQQSQPDIYRPMIDAGGSETFQESFMLPNVRFLGAGTAGAGAPPIGSPGTYISFAYTNAASTASDFAFLRPRFDLMNFPSLHGIPTGSLSIDSFSVTEITLP